MLASYSARQSDGNTEALTEVHMDTLKCNRRRRDAVIVTGSRSGLEAHMCNTTQHEYQTAEYHDAVECSTRHTTPRPHRVTRCSRGCSKVRIVTRTVELELRKFDRCSIMDCGTVQ